MPRIYDKVDLVFTDDFFVAPDGDILASDESVNLQAVPRYAGENYRQALSDVPLVLQPIARYILDVCQSETNSWRYNPAAAANLSNFLGYPNTEQLSKDMETSIRKALSVNKNIANEDLAITIFPVTSKILFIKIELSVQPTKANQMTKFISLNSLYNSSIGNLTVVKP